MSVNVPISPIATSSPQSGYVSSNGGFDFGSFLGGAVSAGASVYNTTQQVAMNNKNNQTTSDINAENLAYNREVNAQNQYNLEHAWQIAAKDIEAAGLSKSLLAGGANGFQQVAMKQDAYHGNAPQSDLGSVLSNVLLNYALEKQKVDIAKQNADTEEKKVENDYELGKARIAEDTRQYDLSHALALVSEANTVRGREEALAENKRQFDIVTANQVKQFEAEFQQNDTQFNLKLNQQIYEFEKEYGHSIVMDDFKRQMDINRYNFDVDSFLTSESNKLAIASSQNESKILTGFMNFMARIITRGLFV